MREREGTKGGDTGNGGPKTGPQPALDRNAPSDPPLSEVSDKTADTSGGLLDLKEQFKTNEGLLRYLNEPGLRVNSPGIDGNFRHNLHHDRFFRNAIAELEDPKAHYIPAPRSDIMSSQSFHFAKVKDESVPIGRIWKILTWNSDRKDHPIGFTVQVPKQLHEDAPNRESLLHTNTVQFSMSFKKDTVSSSSDISFRQVAIKSGDQYEVHYAAFNMKDRPPARIGSIKLTYSPEGTLLTIDSEREEKGAKSSSSPAKGQLTTLPLGNSITEFIPGEKRITYDIDSKRSISYNPVIKKEHSLLLEGLVPDLSSPSSVPPARQKDLPEGFLEKKWVSKERSALSFDLNSISSSESGLTIINSDGFDKVPPGRQCEVRRLTLGRLVEETFGALPKDLSRAPLEKLDAALATIVGGYRSLARDLHAIGDTSGMAKLTDEIQRHSGRFIAFSTQLALQNPTLRHHAEVFGLAAENLRHINLSLGSPLTYSDRYQTVLTLPEANLRHLLSLARHELPKDLEKRFNTYAILSGMFYDRSFSSGALVTDVLPYGINLSPDELVKGLQVIYRKTMEQLPDSERRKVLEKGLLATDVECSPEHGVPLGIIATLLSAGVLREGPNFTLTPSVQSQSINLLSTDVPLGQVNLIRAYDQLRAENSGFEASMKEKLRALSRSVPPFPDLERVVEETLAGYSHLQFEKDKDGRQKSPLEMVLATDEHPVLIRVAFAKLMTLGHAASLIGGERFVARMEGEKYEVRAVVSPRTPLDEKFIAAQEDIFRYLNGERAVDPSQLRASYGDFRSALLSRLKESPASEPVVLPGSVVTRGDGQTRELLSGLYKGIMSHLDKPISYSIGETTYSYTVDAKMFAHWKDFKRIEGMNISIDLLVAYANGALSGGSPPVGDPLVLYATRAGMLREETVNGTKVFVAGAGRSLIVSTSDELPHEMTHYVQQQSPRFDSAQDHFRRESWVRALPEKLQQELKQIDLLKGVEESRRNMEFQAMVVGHLIDGTRGGGYARLRNIDLLENRQAERSPSVMSTDQEPSTPKEQKSLFKRIFGIFQRR